jgi:hypothetical protein
MARPNSYGFPNAIYRVWGPFDHGEHAQAALGRGARSSISLEITGRGYQNSSGSLTARADAGGLEFDTRPGYKASTLSLSKALRRCAWTLWYTKLKRPGPRDSAAIRIASTTSRTVALCSRSANL